MLRTMRHETILSFVGASHIRGKLVICTELLSKKILKKTIFLFYLWFLKNWIENGDVATLIEKQKLPLLLRLKFGVNSVLLFICFVIF